MPKPFKPKVITSNALLEGDVVYLAADDTWVRDLTAAEVHTEQNTAETRLAQANTRQHEIVGAYLADVAVGENGAPEPVHFREEFRRTGPSNYFHGKQVDASDQA